jgi:hypothetical protein
MQCTVIRFRPRGGFKLPEVRYQVAFCENLQKCRHKNIFTKIVPFYHQLLTTVTSFGFFVRNFRKCQHMLNFVIFVYFANNFREDVKTIFAKLVKMLKRNCSFQS